MPVRIAAISFLNPAPLLYNFEHEPAATDLRTRYSVHYTSPARCAAQLHAGEADLGLIPVAELTPALAVVPGCVIASFDEVRSILLLVRTREDLPEAAALHGIASIAADTASRSSVAYVRTILKRFHGADPHVEPYTADPLPMLAAHDAALLIGDPALLARERRDSIDAAIAQQHGARLLWIDVARLWRQHTGLPWVAAVWAVRPEALPTAGVTAQQLIGDLVASRNAGLAHIEEIIAEWLPRLPLRPGTLRTYLTRNIHYVMDESCLHAIRTFRTCAAEEEVLPPLATLPMLVPGNGEAPHEPAGR